VQGEGLQVGVLRLVYVCVLNVRGGEACRRGMKGAGHCTTHRHRHRHTHTQTQTHTHTHTHIHTIALDARHTLEGDAHLGERAVSEDEGHDGVAPLQTLQHLL
jgi:hypothetical protein